MIYQHHDAYSELSISISNYYSVNSGLHLDKEIVEKVNKLGASTVLSL